MTKRLTLAEMSERLNFKTSRTFKNYVVNLGIPHFGIGRNMRFDAERVEKFLETIRQPARPSNVLPMPRKKRKVVHTKSKFAEAAGI